MKTQEEIEQLAKDMLLNESSQRIFILAYNQCQQDMIKEPNYATKGDYCAVCGSTEFHNDEEE